MRHIYTIDQLHGLCGKIWSCNNGNSTYILLKILENLVRISQEIFRIIQCVYEFQLSENCRHEFASLNFRRWALWKTDHFSITLLICTIQADTDLMKIHSITKYLLLRWAQTKQIFMEKTRLMKKILSTPNMANLWIEILHNNLCGKQQII